MVECEAGYNGGLTQKYHLDVYNSAVDHLQVNITSVDAPIFSVSRLPAGTPFVLVIYASNEKGKSNSVALMGSTLALESTETGEYYYFWKCCCDICMLLQIMHAAFLGFKRKENDAKGAGLILPF